MTNSDKPILRTKVSRNELERRWKAVRKTMRESGLDFLIMQNYTDVLGGYVKWFTDRSARNNYPFSLIFARDEDMTIIAHGARVTSETGLPAGVKKQIGVPALPSLSFSSTFEVEAMVAELEKYPDSRMGLVGLGHISTATYNYLTKHLNPAKFSDATELVDNIKVIKSEEEIQHLSELAALQDATLEYALTVIKPGRRDFEVYADIMHQCLQTGSSQVNLGVDSGTYGEPPPAPFSGDRNRVLRDGDQIALLIESNGPSGYYTEILRPVCIGRVSPELQEQFEATKELQRITLGLLKPGTEPMEIWEANNRFLNKMGYREEKRLLYHGMGYDMVERPCVELGETMKIRAGMNIAAHATVASAKAFSPLCENYIVTENGNYCLHKSPQKIFVV